jgi:hypoxia up-regulated 1
MLTRTRRPYWVIHTNFRISSHYIGAAFRAAAVSPQFRVKQIAVKDITAFPILMKFPKDSEGFVNQKLFPKFSLVGSRKKVTFKKHKNFILSFDYENSTIVDDP